LDRSWKYVDALIKELNQLCEENKSLRQLFHNPAIASLLVGNEEIFDKKHEFGFLSGDDLSSDSLLSSPAAFYRVSTPKPPPPQPDNNAQFNYQQQRLLIQQQIDQIHQKILQTQQNVQHEQQQQQQQQQQRYQQNNQQQQAGIIEPISLPPSMRFENHPMVRSLQLESIISIEAAHISLNPLANQLHHLQQQQLQQQIDQIQQQKQQPNQSLHPLNRPHQNLQLSSNEL